MEPPSGIINAIVSFGGLLLLKPSEMQTEAERKLDPDQHDGKESQKTTMKSLFILPIVLLGMVTETLVAMIVNTIESFYPNYYSVNFGKQEGYVGTVLACAG